MLSFKTTGYTTNIGGLHIRPTFGKRKTLETVVEPEFSQYAEKGLISVSEVEQTQDMKTVRRKRQSQSKKRSVPSKKVKKTQVNRKRSKSVIKHIRKNINKPKHLNKDRF